MQQKITLEEKETFLMLKGFSLVQFDLLKNPNKFKYSWYLESRLYGCSDYYSIATDDTYDYAIKNL